MGYSDDHREEMMEAGRLETKKLKFELMGLEAFKNGADYSEKPPGLSPEQTTQWNKGWNEAAEQGDPDLKHI